MRGLYEELVAEAGVADVVAQRAHLTNGIGTPDPN